MLIKINNYNKTPKLRQSNYIPGCAALFLVNYSGSHLVTEDF